MSNTDTPNDDSEGVKSLRAALEKANQELATLRSSQRVNDLRASFSAKKVDSKFLDLYPADGDLGEDAVAQWAEKYGLVTADATPQTPPQQTGNLNPLAGLDENSLAALMGAQVSTPSQDAIAPFSGAVGDPAALQKVLKTGDYAQLVRAGLMPDVDNGKYRAGTSGR